MDTDKIVLDAGAVYIDGQLLSPCEGDNTFAITREYRDIPVNGAAGKLKGLKRILTENAVITVHPKNLTQDVLKMAIPGCGDVDGVLSSAGRKVISTSEYHTVLLVGFTMDGTLKAITLYNALVDANPTIGMSESSEVVLELAFSGHYDPSNMEGPLYTIEDNVAAGTSTVTFTLSGGAGAATVVFAGRSIKQVGGGTVVFTGIMYGDNRPYSVYEDGHESVFGSVTVNSPTEAVAVAMVEL